MLWFVWVGVGQKKLKKVSSALSWGPVTGTQAAGCLQVSLPPPYLKSQLLCWPEVTVDMGYCT